MKNTSKVLWTLTLLLYFASGIVAFVGIRSDQQLEVPVAKFRSLIPAFNDADGITVLKPRIIESNREPRFEAEAYGERLGRSFQLRFSADLTVEVDRESRQLRVRPNGVRILSATTKLVDYETTYEMLQNAFRPGRKNIVEHSVQTVLMDVVRDIDEKVSAAFGRKSVASIDLAGDALHYVRLDRVRAEHMRIVINVASYGLSNRRLMAIAINVVSIVAMFWLLARSASRFESVKEFNERTVREQGFEWVQLKG